MISTPKKKRSASTIVSPARQEEDKSNSRGTNRKKPTKKYQFLPLNKLGGEEPVLKSIPISKVRNGPQNSSEKKSLDSNKLPKKSAGLKPPKELISDHSFRDGPSEVVIWRYSPEKADTALKLNLEDTEYGADEDIDEMHIAQSSTPIINDKFKDLIDFENMNPSSEKRDGRKTLHYSPSKRAGKSETPGRDIAAILQDLDQEKVLPPSSPNYCEHISIEDEQEKEEKEEEKEKKEGSMQHLMSPKIIENRRNDDEAIIVDDEDDSLIDILTQRFTKPVIFEQELNSQESEDSILDILESNNKKEGKKIERIEIVLEESEEDKIRRFAELAKLPFVERGFQRLCIYDIKEMAKPKQIILTCIDSSASKVNVILREPWIRFKYENGMIIHLVAGENFPNKRLLSADKDPKTGLENDNLLIVYPDVLLSATTLGAAMDCERRAVLSTKLNEPGEYSLPATLGNIIHELIQSLLKLKLVESNQFVSKGLALELLDKVIVPYKKSILMCNETIESVIKTIADEHLSFIIEFINIYVTPDNTRSWVQVIGSKTKRKLSIAQVIDIEENIWSSKYGLKGFIDVTAETNADEDGKKLINPIEIKTGKWKSNAHEAQGLIYTLLLQDRYDLPINAHLMLYTKLKEFSQQPKVLISLKHLLNLRNKIAKYLHVMNEEMNEWPKDTNVLPPMIQNSKCDQCFVRDSCMILNRLSTKEDAPTLLKHEYEIITAHLRPEAALSSYRSFYQKYDNLLMMEETSIMSNLKDTFLSSAENREIDSGNCLSALALLSLEDGLGGYTYKFIRNQQADSSPSMLHSNILPNDYVMISDYYGHLAIGSGTVQEITDNYVIVKCRRRIDRNNVHRESFDKFTRQVVQSVLKKKGSSPHPPSSGSKTTENILYRIDKNDSSIGLTLARYNLLSLFLPEVDPHRTQIDANGKELVLKRSQGGYTRGRRLIVDLDAPRWPSSHKNRSIYQKYSSLKDFNQYQIDAIEKAITCKDYALILGMPGTGKTSVICEIARILVAQDKSILLASYTNSAVDNVMNKLSETLPDEKLVRLGAPYKVHPNVRKYCIDSYNNADNAQETTADIHNSINRPQVVAVTCLGINDPWLQLRTSDFDYVILDEASQISLPVALGPLRFAPKFVLVGDHYQLPPLVKNNFARKNGLQESLFQRLCNAHPESVAELRAQYRMNKEIMSLSNVLIYNGRLECGSPVIATQRLTLSPLNSANDHSTPTPSHLSWIDNVLDPEKPVVVLNYDEWRKNSSLLSHFGPLDEINNSGQIHNPAEARIIGHLISALQNHGVSNERIGIITIYRAQMLHLQSVFSAQENGSGLEILTADQFQGRDKDCIIISMVRSNLSSSTGMLLHDLRRINVAMSRAKLKLIVVCSWQSISCVSTLADFISHVEINKWLLYPPPFPLKH